MRQKTTAGLVLLAAPVLVIALSSWIGLELESYVLLGVAVGAVVGLVPDRTPLVRLGGAAAGVIIAWVGYVVRAAVLPDSSAGRAVTFALVLLACVALAAVVNAVPLWSLLLGVAAVAGAYEYTFAAAPTEVASTSLTAVTALLITAAVGFLASSTFSAPAERATSGARPTSTPERTARLDDLMEHSK